MEPRISAATWFLLLVPMLSVVGLSAFSLLKKGPVRQPREPVETEKLEGAR